MSDPKANIEERVTQLARLEAEAEDLRHELEIAKALAARRGRECARLEREAAALRTERDSLRRRLEEQSRLLGMILQSRSFRWMQAARRMLGRE